MSAQRAFALPSPAASNTVVINARCSLRMEADERVIVLAGLPVHLYRAEDAVTEALCDGVLGGGGVCPQIDVAQVLGRSVRPVRRYQERYAQGGMAALDRPEGWRRISGKRPRSIERLKSEGLSNRAIAHRLGVSEKAIRKLAGASKPAASEQLVFAETPTTAARRPPATCVPSATSTGDDAARAMPSADDRADDCDPIPTADDGEAVPMSLNHDASDRTFDRQLACLGLLDDLLRISRKLSGEIGPAFYGLTTWRRREWSNCTAMAWRSWSSSR